EEVRRFLDHIWLERMNTKRIKFRDAQCVGYRKAGRSIWKKLLQETDDCLTAVPVWAALTPVPDADGIGRCGVDLLRVREGQNDFGRSVADGFTSRHGNVLREGCAHD